MENVSKTNDNLVLLGVIELENLRYLYATLAVTIYISTMMLSSLIVYTVWVEETLHEPMYIFIANLIVNVMYGNSAIVPKIVIDLLFGWRTISLPGCLIQAFCFQSFTAIEFCTFTAMAYDRLLAVSLPLRYSILMTNGKAFQIILAILSYVFLGIGVVVVLAARLTICGVYINNIYCETLSLLHLSCDDTTVNNIYGTIWTMTVAVSCILGGLYCYIRTFLICMKNSTEAYQKAIHTLVTHVVTSCICSSATLFVIFRYRLGGGSLSTVSHVAISITGLTVSITLNPLIYGIRTKNLKNKMISNLQKIGAIIPK
ncbi:olfactory receptor 52B6-like [Leptodactylus fuscus]|uniref:olfactory receptor 52B6-like n=1 Tax=Leptodactylus fuscus TaxID=238119 RepID=UPI003F4E94F6